MRWIRFILCAAAITVFGCKSIAPTPLLIGELKEANNKLVAAYMACSEGPLYTPEKEGCDPEKLELQAKHTMDLAKNFISADIRQPHGYDIYLRAAMIYFRIGQRNGNEYSEAEKIARQFFETQKATSGTGLNQARFYWAAIATAHAAWQKLYDPLALDEARKIELLACYTEALIAYSEMEPGIDKAYLQSYLQTLKSILDSIQ